MWGKKKISLERGDYAPSFHPLTCVVLHREGTHLHSKNPQVLFADCALTTQGQLPALPCPV